MTNNKNDNTLWTPTFIALLVLGTLTSVSFYMINPIISKYATVLGATLGLAGVVSGLFSITALTARPIGAVIVDRLNKKYVLAAATAIMGLAALGYSVSGNIVMLILFRVLHGSAFAVSGTATAALIASVVPRSRLGEGIGYYGMGYIIATAIGPNIGILIADRFGYRINFLSSGIVLLAAAALMTRIPYSRVRTNDGNHKKIALDDLISLKVLPLAFIGGMFSFTNGIVSSFLVLIGEQRGIANIGLYFTVLAVFLFVVRPFTGKLCDRKGISFILYPAFILVMLESLLLSRASVLWIILLAAILKAFGNGAAQPTIQSTCLKKLDPSKSGVAAATFYIGADIGQGVGPMIGGKIAEAYSYELMFYFCIGLLTIGLASFFLYDKIDKKHRRNSETESAETV